MNCRNIAMFKTLYAAAPHETPFSLMVALASTTIAMEIRCQDARAFQQGSKFLQTTPCCLSRFCALTDGVYGTPRQVLVERTLYPLYMGCMSAQLAATLEDETCNGCRGRPCGPALPGGLHSVNRYGVECPECSSDTWAQTGRRCSLAFHCIPLQARCPIHGGRYRLAHPCSRFEMSMLMPPDTARKHNTLRLGATLFDFLKTPCSRCWLDDLEPMFRARGYMTGDGRVRRNALVRDFTALYSAGFEDSRLEAWTGSGGPAAHVLLRLGHPQPSPHPIEVALLRNALDEIEFTLPPAKAGPSKRTRLPDNAVGLAGEQMAADLSPDKATHRSVRHRGPGRSVGDVTRVRVRTRRADSASAPREPSADH
jgi:hypothetical protein